MPTDIGCEVFKLKDLGRSGVFKGGGFQGRKSLDPRLRGDDDRRELLAIGSLDSVALYFVRLAHIVSPSGESPFRPAAHSRG